MSASEGWLDAGILTSIPAGKVKLVVDESQGLRLAVCNVDGQYYAIEDVCTHDGGPLDQGDLQGDEIECPRHGACFNVRTGQATRMPAVMPVQTYPVKIDGDHVFVGTSPQEMA